MGAALVGVLLWLAGALIMLPVKWIFLPLGRVVEWLDERGDSNL